jgi:DNA-binding transcriptional LysR family regulator
MNLGALKAFAVVAEELHFGRAAARLGMAQPNLSALIQRLEQDMAVRLFRRRPRVELTEAGSVLRNGATAIFAQIDAVAERAKIAGDGRIGAVHVGFASTAMLTPLSEAFRAFRREYPEVDLQLREMHSGVQWEALKSGTIDAAITREVRPDDAISRSLIVSEKFVAVLPKSHALGRNRIVLTRNLALEPFIVSRRAVAPVLHDQIIAICVTAGFMPKIVQEADEWHTVFGFVRSGFGVAIAPEGLTRLGWRGVAFRPLDEKSVRANLHLCWNAQRASPVVLRFVAAMQAAMLPYARPSIGGAGASRRVVRS